MRSGRGIKRVLLITAATAAACSSNAATHSSVASTSTTDKGMASHQSSASTPATTAGNQPGTPAATTPSTTAAKVAAGGVTTPSSSPASTAASSKSAAVAQVPGQLAPTAPGTYTMRQQGSYSIGSDNFTDPDQGTMVVGAPSSSGVEAWQSYVQQNQPPQTSDVQFRSDGPFLISETESSPQGNVTCTFDPAIPAPTWPAAVGDSFQSTGNCGKFTVVVAGRITGTRNLSVGGTSYPCWVIDSTLTLKGQVSGSGTQEDWYSPALRLPVYQHSTVQATYGVFSFKSQLATWLESARPT